MLPSISSFFLWVQKFLHTEMVNAAKCTQGSSHLRSATERERVCVCVWDGRGVNACKNTCCRGNRQIGGQLTFTREHTMVGWGTH